uniref:Potassium channel domain-containing protein n=1 Tax=Parascaris univalens TaxID=6257 RepID=A0A915AAF3_PARUN
MFVSRTFLFRLRLQKAKPFTLHCSLLLLVLLYAFLGGLIFNKLEAEALVRQQNDEYDKRRNCVLEILLNWNDDANETATTIMECWKKETDERTEWSYVTSTLYGFGIVTTLGYNRIAPITQAGRMFCILYGICGIPITMIIIANVGQYLNQFARNSRIKIEQYRDRRRRLKSTDEVRESSIEFASLALLIAFLLYVSFGALLLPLLNGQIDFFNGLYFNFLCLTAIDFGQLVPQRVAFLPITFIYVCVGLAITTIAIDVGSEYMKKLHYLGKKMKDAASTKIWFGGKSMKVRDLLHAVGKKCGVEPEFIDGIDLDNVVECVIAINEGRVLPTDLNDEPAPPRAPTPKAPSETQARSSSQAPSEASPLLTDPPTPVKRTQSRPSLLSKSSRPPSMSTQSDSTGSDSLLRNQTFMSHVSVGESPMLEAPFLDTVFDDGEMVTITIPPEAESNEETLDFTEPEVLARGREVVEVEMPFSVAETSEVKVVEQPSVKLLVEDSEEEEEEEEEQMDESLEGEDEFSDGASTARSPTPEDGRVPRKFLEKKELYGRDARKLFQTYQEEWERLERLSDRRLGPRRKSVLAQSSHNLNARERSLSRDRSSNSIDARINDSPFKNPRNLNL